MPGSHHAATPASKPSRPTLSSKVFMTCAALSWGPWMNSGLPSYPKPITLGPSQRPRWPAHDAKLGWGSKSRPRAYSMAPTPGAVPGREGLPAGVVVGAEPGEDELGQHAPVQAAGAAGVLHPQAVGVHQVGTCGNLAAPLMGELTPALGPYLSFLGGLRRGEAVNGERTFLSIMGSNSRQPTFSVATVPS
jgi:hypothetical protein